MRPRSGNSVSNQIVAFADVASEHDRLPVADDDGRSDSRLPDHRTEWAQGTGLGLTSWLISKVTFPLSLIRGGDLHDYADRAPLDCLGEEGPAPRGPGPR